jgi:hypothetical protein
MKTKYLFSLIFFTLIFSSCEKEKLPVDPATAERVEIDRFNESSATLYIRDDSNNFPGPNQAIDFDQHPFISTGYGPNGEIVKYYNMDVQPLKSAPIFVLFREGDSNPVENQLNIIDVIPGDEGYSDFWSMVKVTVPEDYIANTVTSFEEIEEEKYPREITERIINCPVVPEGSTAKLRYRSEESITTHQGWYKGKAAFYFTFEEKELSESLPPNGYPNVSFSIIMVTFNINPDLTGGGPPSGFVTEPGSDQTHNVLETLPEDDTYSPLWIVDIYDNADFDTVSDWESAISAEILETGVMMVNCPVVSVE